MPDCGAIESHKGACLNHNVFDERIHQNGKAIETLFAYQRTLVPSKLFWAAMGIIISILSWVTLSLWSMKAEINQMNIQTIQTLNAVQVQQAVIQNDLRYIAEQVKKNGSEKGGAY